VSEVAVSVALLVGAGLMVKSLVTVLRSDNGFDPNGVLTMEIKVSRGNYRKPPELSRFLSQALETVQSQPGVEKATISSNLPGFTDGWQNEIAPEGHPAGQPGEMINVDWAIVTADYFETMKIAILRGRTFTRDEVEHGKPVLLVDENLARRFWPNENAVGKHLKYDGPVWHEIIGVVPEVRAYGSTAKPLIKMYTPLGRSPQRNSTLSIRYNNVDPQALTAAVMRAISTLDKNVPVNDIATLESLLAREASPRRFNAILFAAFGVLALVLAATGVYGVLSYSVSQRTHEVGIRMALGAGHRDVLRLFMGQGMALVLLGLVLGLAGAFALTRLMSSLLFGVSTTDAMTFVEVAVGLVLIGLFACYIPARRATKVDPLVALRYE
jgi:putative ABC transport system permease protein